MAPVDLRMDSGGWRAKDRIRRALRQLPPLLALVALIQPITRALGRLDWRLDLMSHFQDLGLAITVLAAVTLLATRRRMAIPILLLAAFQAEPIVRYSFANPVHAGPSSARLRILMANVLVDNQDYRAVAKLIRETKPDIVALVEVSDAWVLGLDEIAREFPYRMDAPNESQGISLWFKERPISIDPAVIPSEGGWPYLHATFRFAGDVRHLWVLHPASPMRRLGRFAGFPEFDALAERIRSQGGSTIVVGDMNTTDGSPYFRDFLKTTGLRDSRLGFGRQLSWPVGFPYQIAIDHAFVSTDLAVVDRRQGPPIGSDHRPFWLDLSPATRAADTASAHAAASVR